MAAAPQIPRAGGLWGRSTRPVVLGALGLMAFIAFESFAVTTALPVVAADLSAERWYSLAFAATATTGLVGMTVGGRWADLRGPAAPPLWGGLTFLSGIALCVLAPGMGVFVLGRLLQGLGGGIDSVVLYVVIARFVPGELRTRMFGLLTAAWLLPAAVGPLVTGLLVELVHWRAVFALALAGAAVSLARLFGVARTAAPGGAGGRVPDARCVWAAAAAVAVLGLHLAGQRPPPWLGVWTLASVAAVALTAARLLPGGTMRARAGIPRLVALRGLLGGATAATDVYLPLYLQYERGYSPAAAGAVVAVGALGWALGAWLQGRPGTEERGAAVLRGAAPLVACGPVLAAAFVCGLVPVAVVIAGCVLMGVGMGIAYPQVTASVLTLSPPERQGEHSSGLQISESLGASVLMAVTGAVLTASALSGYPYAYAVVTGVALLALALTWAPRPEGSRGAGRPARR
ncbi:MULTISPECIES: MFS transporter [unclassified Nocardiopsis]|uniref:MFS transporter n=1 Tax=unclassified Nocardiopsis TaxID=2649073 RepID=UPI00135B5463|nr:MULTISPECIES: MFS transporter [unclassified Nocardiopsis]